MYISNLGLCVDFVTLRFLAGIHSLMTHTDVLHPLIHTMTDSAMILTGKKKKMKSLVFYFVLITCTCHLL